MNINRPPNWLRKIYYSLQWNVSSKSKNLYLTFDDGPTPEITDWVLNELKKVNAKATFFCIGRNVERYPDIYNRIVNDDHAVGNHTYSHLNGWKTWYHEYIDDVNLASEFVKSRLFRPPYGKIRQNQIRNLRKHGFKLFMWDVLSEDYNNDVTPDQCLENVLNYTEKGSIIVFHDSVKASNNLYEVLPQILKIYTEKGYKFKRLK